MTSTYKKRPARDYGPHLQPFIDLVESGDLRTSKEVKALVDHVKYCLDNEDIYVDEELADH